MSLLLLCNEIIWVLLIKIIVFCNRNEFTVDYFFIVDIPYTRDNDYVNQIFNRFSINILKRYKKVYYQINGTITTYPGKYLKTNIQKILNQNKMFYL